MIITEQWGPFIQSDIPIKIRKEILEALRWIEQADPIVLQDISENLLAQRMVNIYLEGVNSGLKIANQNMKATLSRIGKGK